LTVLITNLRIKREIAETTSSMQFFQKNTQKETYCAGDMIQFSNHKKFGMILETSPDLFTVLDEHNRCVQVRLPDVSRKLVMSRHSQGIDCDNNVIARSTLVKIKDRQDPLFGQLGEIKALFRDCLFVWIKNSLLVKTNGIYCIRSKQVINAGATHMKEANENAGIDVHEYQANPDRQKKDSLLRGHTVSITRGHLKGYRGTVVSANETFAEVHVHSKCAKFAIARADLYIIHNAMEGMRIDNNGAHVPVHLSFDEAANQEYVNV